jgi:hypothetical protein
MAMQGTMIEVGLTLQQLTCQADSTDAATKERVCHGTWVEPCSQADSSPLVAYAATASTLPELARLAHGCVSTLTRLASLPASCPIRCLDHNKSMSHHFSHSANPGLAPDLCPSETMLAGGLPLCTGVNHRPSAGASASTAEIVGITNDGK